MNWPDSTTIYGGNDDNQVFAEFQTTSHSGRHSTVVGGTHAVGNKNTYADIHFIADTHCACVFQPGPRWLDHGLADFRGSLCGDDQLGLDLMAFQTD